MGTPVTVIVPTFNERDNVAELVSRSAAALAGYDAEILFVDDSTDDTAAEVERVAADAAIPVRVIHRAENTGASAVPSWSGSKLRHPTSAS
ncbi:glycosyltransferase [Microbacterium sp. Se63.02b]|uniref:glycosyltransferase n=1 Tax=Microbacterium sp. Se63.02b TaxID=2709304 RepID=UPI00237BB2F0|nr:glycosyltransferase [Microbacterium sp. Se63.02b]